MTSSPTLPTKCVSIPSEASQAAAFAPEPPATAWIGAKVSVPKATGPSVLAIRS